MSSKAHEEKLLNEGRDIGYQQREWIAQRIAWVVMLLVVITALPGLLGASGWLSSTNATAGDGQGTDHGGRFSPPPGNRRGSKSLDQIKIAVLERSGGISVIPWPSSSTSSQGLCSPGGSQNTDIPVNQAQSGRR